MQEENSQAFLEMVKRYSSRKFMITILCILCATGLAAFELLTNPVALVLSAAIASYNWANSRMGK